MAHEKIGCERVDCLNWLKISPMGVYFNKITNLQFSLKKKGIS
jgi:hypothetical protein